MHHLSSLPLSLLLLLSAPRYAQSFYLPGVAPVDYKVGDKVALTVNPLSPSQSQSDNEVHSVYSYDYYDEHFHFCQPENGPENKAESLGSIIFGDRIQSSPFDLKMRVNETCKSVCEAQEYGIADAQFVNQRILQGYNLNWFIDGLPAAQPVRDPNTGQKFYMAGFALGNIDNGDGVPVMNTHYDIYVDYHQAGPDKYRVVGTVVEPFSLKGAKDLGGGRAECPDTAGVVQLSETSDTTVTFTYSVFWIPSDTTFATRYDKLLHVYDPKIHWWSLTGSAVIVFMLIGMVSTVLMRTLRKDIARYNRLDQLGLDNLGDTSLDETMQEDSGWKLVHGDVFRPPKRAMVLSILVGNGAHLFMMTGFLIVFALLGFLSPSSRGSLGTVMILLYTLLSFVGGYVAARTYKLFQGDQWKLLFVLTPFIVPAMVFSTFFALNLFVWARHASGAVPFTTMIVIIGIWFFISLPLSFLGSWLGFKQSMPDPPVRTNQIPRQIPPSQGWMRPVPSMLMVGILPFGAIFVELYFIMNSIWSSKIYYMFGFLFLCFGLMVVTSAAVTVLMIYFLLCTENYHWQWRAFFTSGSSAIYIFAYSLLFWMRSLMFTSWTSGVLYLGYSLLISGLWFVMTGTIGFVCTWGFVQRIYGSIKID